MTEFPAFTGNMSRQGLLSHLAPVQALGHGRAPADLSCAHSEFPSLWKRILFGQYSNGLNVSMGHPACSRVVYLPGSWTSNALLVCSASYSVFWCGGAFRFEGKELYGWHLSGSHPHPSRWEAHSWVHSFSHAQFPWDLRWQALGAELNLQCGVGL